MLEGIKEDIVCLPVHDAVAVQQKHLNGILPPVFDSVTLIAANAKTLGIT